LIVDQLRTEVTGDRVVAPTAVAGLLVLLQFAGLWYAVPLRRRAHLNRR
jgi:hypothetical protein